MVVAWSPADSTGNDAGAAGIFLRPLPISQQSAPDKVHQDGNITSEEGMYILLVTGTHPSRGYCGSHVSDAFDMERWCSCMTISRVV